MDLNPAPRPSWTCPTCGASSSFVFEESLTHVGYGCVDCGACWSEQGVLPRKHPITCAQKWQDRGTGQVFQVTNVNTSTYLVEACGPGGVKCTISLRDFWSAYELLDKTPISGCHYGETWVNDKGEPVRIVSLDTRSQTVDVEPLRTDADQIEWRIRMNGWYFMSRHTHEIRVPTRYAFVLEDWISPDAP